MAHLASKTALPVVEFTTSRIRGKGKRAVEPSENSRMLWDNSSAHVFRGLSDTRLPCNLGENSPHHHLTSESSFTIRMSAQGPVLAISFAVPAWRALPIKPHSGCLTTCTWTPSTIIWKTSLSTSAAGNNIALVDLVCKTNLSPSRMSLPSAMA